MNSEIQAVIFDCFGVLTSDGWLPFADKYFGNNPELKEEARSLNKQVDAGLLDYDSFVQQVAELAGIPVQTAYHDIENNIANDALFEYIASLKPDYKIGLLSNAGQNWLNDLFSPEQVALFDATVFSYELGVVKPHERMYQTICDRLGVEPSKAVFVDDIDRYAFGGEPLGLKGIVYTSNQQVMTDLGQLLHNSNK